MFIDKAINVLNTWPPVGGLEISDSALRFIRAKGDELISSSLKLPPGIIENGKIKDRANFVSALRTIRSQITGGKSKKVYVIASIPPSNVYTQSFNLPSMENGKNLDEAVRLNLQMISPIDLSSAYYDWQKIGESKGDGNEVDILAAFTNGALIDGFNNCLREAGFMASAFEFPALSLCRLISELGTEVSNPAAKSLPYILFQTGSSGLDFSIIKNGNLYFNYFVPWDEAMNEGQQISMSAFRSIVIREVKKVSNFYSSRWGGDINNLILVSTGLDQEIIKIISENFPIKVFKPTLGKFKGVTPDWFVALGLALRGLIQRSSDTIISLARVGTEQEFYQYKIMSFIGLWRNVLIAAILFFLIVFIGFDVFLRGTESSLAGRLSNFTNQDGLTELSDLQSQAKDFNTKLDFAINAKKQSTSWSPFLEKIISLAGGDISINRIYVQSPDMPVLLSGSAAGENSVINYKNNLAAQPQFQDVTMPLSNITSGVGNSVNFTINFKIKNLNF